MSTCDTMTDFELFFPMDELKLNPDVFTKVSEFLGGNQIPLNKQHELQVKRIRTNIVNEALTNGLFLDFFLSEDNVLDLQERMTDDEKNIIHDILENKNIPYFHCKEKYLFSDEMIGCYPYLIFSTLPVERTKQIFHTKEYEEYVCKEWNNPYSNW